MSPSRVLFLPPPFDADDTLTAILGGPGLPATAPATLADFAVRRDTAGVAVALAEAPGAATEGVLVEAAGPLQARLDFALATFGAVPVAVTVMTGDGPVAAEAFVFRGAVPEGQGAPTGEDRARLIEALFEIMGQYGRRPAGAMPALLHGIGVRALGRARAPQADAPVLLGTPRAPGDIEPVAGDFAYANYFGVEEHRLRHRRFDGTMSKTVARAVFTSGDAVTVLPFDPRTGEVLIIEQFRAGPYVRRDPRPWSLEPIAGRCDRAEPLEETARREAREEADLALGRMERIAGFYPSPGIMSEYITGFVAEADLSQAGGVHGLAEEDEDIRTIVVPLADALAAAAAGEVNNAPLLLTLFWLDRNAERLRAAWS